MPTPVPNFGRFPVYPLCLAGDSESAASETGGRPADREAPVWSAAFDASSVGALSPVWGHAPDDVLVVGGTPEQGEVYHYDGVEWRAMRVPEVPLLVWVYGFAADDVIAVGVGGGMIRFDGTAWTTLDSGTTEDLWGQSPHDIWIVGGNVGQDDPVILRFDGASIRRIRVPANDRNATSLFKVWGIGSRLFAVGERGLVLQYDGTEWFQVPAGPNANEDFVSLWGVSEGNMVAVGGCTRARIAVHDGIGWTTHAPTATPGLNAVCVFDANEAVVGDVNGYVGAYDPFTNTPTAETRLTDLPVHAAWADGAGRCYAVGWLDACDNCVNVANADQADSDSDRVGDVCDRCPGADDTIDTDADGVPNACEACPGSDDALDADADTTSDGCDVCPGFDDRIDNDADSVPDGCDACLGFDDRIDSDGNGVPDGCCGAEPDCDLGESCLAGVCQPSSPDVELGYEDPFVRIPEGGVMPITPGFQGLGDLYLSYRTLGFTPNGPAIVTLEVTLIDDGRAVAGTAPPFAVIHRFSEVSPGINEGLNDYWVVPHDPFLLFGRPANVVLTITDDTDPSISATLRQTVVLMNANDLP